MGLFELKKPEVKPNNQEKAERENSAFTSKYLNKHLDLLENISEDLVRFPAEGEIFFLQTLQAFNAFTFIQKIAKTYFIEELVATTYSVSMRVMEALQELQRLGKIGEIKLLISDSMMSRNPKVTDALDAWASTDANVKLIYTWNHSKITLAKTAEQHFCIEGSGNWSENACYEQYIFYNDKDVYEFRKQLLYDCKVVRSVN